MPHQTPPRPMFLPVSNRPRQGRFYPNFNNDTPREIQDSFYRTFDDLYQLRTQLTSQLSSIQDLCTRITPDSIRQELQIGGSAPLNVTQLIGSADYSAEDGDGLIARLDGTGTFSGARTITGLWALDPSTGTVPFTTTKTGVVTNLNADQLDGADAESGSGDIARLDGTGAFSGARTVSGVWALNPSSGTVPFTTTQTGLVTNLNADRLDSAHAESGSGEVARLDGTGTLSGARTVTGVWALDPSSGTVPFTTTKTGVVTNLNADQLDGNNAESGSGDIMRLDGTANITGARTFTSDVTIQGLVPTLRLVDTTGSSENFNLTVDADALKFVRLGGTGATPITINSDDSVTISDALEIDGALNHDGSTIGFFSGAPATQGATAFTPVTGGSAQHSFTPNTVTLEELAEYVETITVELQRTNLVP